MASLFEAASPYGWFVLFLFVVGLAAIAIAFVTSRGRPEARLWLVTVVPLILTTTGVGGYAIAAHRLARSLAAEPMDRRLLLRLEARSSSEMLSIPLLAIASSAILLGLGAVVLGAAALRHRSRLRWGVASGAGVAGVAILLVLRRASILPNAAACFAAIAAVLAGASAAGEGDEARDREIGAETLIAAICAIGSVACALVVSHLDHWRDVFDALADEMIDPAERLRIFADGSSDDRALAMAGAVFYLGPFVAIAIALAPRARLVMLSVPRARLALAMALAAVLGAVVTPRLLSAHAASRVVSRAVLVWPEEVSPIVASIEPRLLSDPGSVVFVRKDDACAKAVAEARERFPPWSSRDDLRAWFAFDRETPVTTVHCVLVAMDNDRVAHSFVVMRARFRLQGGAVKDSFETRDAAMVLSATRVQRFPPPAPTRIHVTATTLTGSISPEEKSLVGAERRLIHVTADPDVTIQRLVDAIAESEARADFLLGPPVFTDGT